MINIGLNVLEADGKATPSIQPAPTSVTGFIIRSQRGPANTPVKVTNMREFEETFGEPVDGAYGSYAVRGFFENGGSEAVVVRVTKSVPGKSKAVLKAGRKNKSWDLHPGTNADPKDIEVKLSFIIDTSTSADHVSLQYKPAYVHGNPIGEDAEIQEGAALEIDINGTIWKPQLPKGKVGGVIEEIENQLKRLHEIQVLYDAEKKAFVIYTERGDSKAFLAVKEGPAALALGLTGDDVSHSEKGGGNVAYMYRVEPEEVMNAINGSPSVKGKLLASLRDNILTIERIIAGSSWGVRVPEDDLVMSKFSFEHIDGSDSVPADSCAIADDGSIQAGWHNKENPGTWARGVLIHFEKKAITIGTGQKYLVSITVGKGEIQADKTTVKWVKRYETFSNLGGSKDSRDYFVTRVNDPEIGSTIFRIEDPDNFTLTSDNSIKTLSGGSDATFSDEDVSLYLDRIGDSFEQELFKVQLMCCPESNNQTVVAKGLEYCETKGDCFYATYSSDVKDLAALKREAQLYIADKRYGAMYLPWICVSKPNGGTAWVPPVGHVLGVYARTAVERGVWKAPAGNAAIVRGALDVKDHITDENHTSLVQEANLNCIRFIPGKGIVIDSSRCLSDNALWQYINVRLLFNFVKRSLKDSLRWVVQEPNNEELWKKVKFNSVTPFLMDLWRKGAFGPGTPEQVFEVIVDKSNNKGQDIQNGRLNVDIFFYPSRPAETVVITVGQQESGAFAAG